MIVGNIEIVTFFVILLFLIPVLWNIYKSELFKKFSIVGLIKIFNKSLKLHGIIALCLILLTWVSNILDLKFDDILAETIYTFIVIGIFMYLPTLGILNLLKVTIKKITKTDLTKSK